MSTTTHRITVARGDGIGPEIMESTLQILKAAEAPIEIDPVEIGKAAFEQGHSSGIPPEAWETIRRNSVLLKAPITTPSGGGYKSLNVTIRKSLNLFANVRPARSYGPYVAAVHPTMDLVVVRENEEDLYAGIEHQQTREVAQILKLITRPGSERIVRYAFEYARAYDRHRVTCMTKDNIMKHTDGLFHRVFDEVAQEYPDIEADHVGGDGLKLLGHVLHGPPTRVADRLVVALVQADVDVFAAPDDGVEVVRVLAVVVLARRLGRALIAGVTHWVSSSFFGSGS